MFNGFDFDEMYDLERDPDEMRNVVNDAEYEKATADMRARIYEMMARFTIRMAMRRRSIHRTVTAPRAICRADGGRRLALVRSGSRGTRADGDVRPTI